MKKLLIFLLMAVLLAGTISAFEFDNIKSYDHFKKEVTIRNAFGLGKDIAKIKLNTPLVYHVPRGYQKVAEFNVSSYGEYKSFINRIKLYDKRKGMKEITTERKLDFKYKDYEEVVVNDYKKECSLVMNETTGNETQVCENIIIGNHTEKRVVWRDFNNNIPKGDITIGIFTEVKKGDNIEWIPNFVGVEVTEWAEWTEDLNSGLVSYYKLDETSGSVIDSAGSNDGTNNGATPNVAGKINTAYSFDGNNDYIDLSHITDFYDDLSEGTLSYWFYSDTRHSGAMVWHYEEGGRRFYSVIYNSDKTKLQMGLGSASSVGTHTWNLSSWNHVVVVWNGTHFSQYLNNVLDINSNPYSYDSFTTGDNSPISLGLDASGNQVYFNGIIDEVGLWNRALNDSEISDLYNNGDGITYTKRLKISLLSPVDTYNSTTSSIDFSANVSDPNSLGIANVSLYIDGVINQTNSSGVEGIYNFSVGGLSEGNHNWSVKAVDSTNGDTYESEVRYFNVNTTPIITISSPVSNTNYPTSNIWFNATSSLNVDYWVINYNGTNITIDDQSGTSLSKLLNVNDGTYNLTIYANNSNTGVWGVNNSVKNFMVDVNPPTISVTSPTGTYDYLYEDYNLTLNTTITDPHLDTCWYSYNGENKTFSCSSGVLSTEYFNYTKGVNNLIVYANDTFGRENSTSVSWDYSIFQDNITYNSETLVTNTETFSIGVTSDSSLTNVYLVYNGTEFTTTKDGGTYTSTVDISNSYVGTQQFRFKFNYGGNIYYSPYYNQTVSDVLFTICNATYNVPFINFTFKDEDSNDYTTAEISSATFEYWIDSKDVSKTYNYINTTNKSFYAFCFSHSDKTLNVDMRVAYKNDESPQRVYDPTTMQLTNQTTNKTLYLLKSIDGSYAYFVVYDSNGNSLDGVSVKVTRVISGETILIGQGETDDSGAVNFFINPDVSHTYTFSKEGYSSKILTLTIADSTVREVFLEGGEVTQPDIYDYGKGISINILVVPTNTTINSGIESSNDFLRNNTWYNFTYTISSSYWDLEDWGFTLKYWNGTRIDFVHSTSSSGGTLKVTADTSNQTRIIMEYYYVVNNTYINKTKSWVIYTESPFGISQVVGRANTYLEANLFGFLGNDNGLFGKALLSVVVLVLMVGGLTYRYGMRADVFALGTIFATLLFLNAMNFIPNPDFLVGKGVTLGNFLIYLTGIIIIGFIFKEEMR